MAVSSDGKRRRLRHLLKHDALRRVRWPILKRLGFHAWGDERSSVRGPGVEYAESREYEFGEDARTIDWNLSARSDRIYVRESHPDRGLDAWLIVDASASLDWGTALMLKREAAFDMASAASSLIARHGSRVGAIVFDANVRRILPPVAGRRGRLHLVGSLDADLSSAPTGAATALAAALWQAVKVIRRPGLLIVISDFLAAGGWQRPMAVLGHRHAVPAPAHRVPAPPLGRGQPPRRRAPRVIIYQPAFLLGLLAIPVLLAGYVLAQRRRRAYTLRFTNLELLRSVLPRTPGIRRHVPPAMFVLGGIALLSGLTVPVLNLEIARNNADVVLVMDVSGSMQAADVAPTRLDAAKNAASTLIDQLPGDDRIALISFSSTATLQQGLTTDRQAVKGAVSSL